MTNVWVVEIRETMYYGADRCINTLVFSTEEKATEYLTSKGFVLENGNWTNPTNFDLYADIGWNPVH